MTLLSLNKAALRAILAYIDSQPEVWDQRWFAPVGERDGMCLAGIACHLAGWNVPELFNTGGHWAIYERAKRLLGLTEHQANRLFYWYYGTSPADLREEIRAVTGWDVDADG